MNKYFIVFTLFLVGCGNPAAYTQIIKGEPGPTGSSGLSGVEGKDGESVVGPTGSPGIDASPCVVTQVPEGVVITCGNTSGLILHGVQGPTGESGKYNHKPKKGHH